MMSPAAMGPRTAEAPMTGPKRLTAEGTDQNTDALGNEEGAEAALEQTCSDEHGRVDSEAADEGGQGEPGDADEEDAAFAVPVAEAAPDDEEHADGESVAGTQPFHEALTTTNFPDDGGRGDVRDGGVH
jgi:hypothetical protein